MSMELQAEHTSSMPTVLAPPAITPMQQHNARPPMPILPPKESASGRRRPQPRAFLPYTGSEHTDGMLIVEPPPIAALSESKPCRQAQAEAWLSARFSSVKPKDISAGGLFVISTFRLKPPPVWESIWWAFNGGDELQHRVDALPSETTAILLLCDTNSQTQLGMGLEIVDCLCSLQSPIPPVFVMSHSVAPENRTQNDYGVEGLELIHSRGADDVIEGEPAGIQMVLALRSRISRQERCMQQCQKRIDEIFERDAQREELKANIHNIIWDYLPVRLTIPVPRVDFGIGAGMPADFAGYRCTQLIGKGNFGHVFQIEGGPDEIDGGPDEDMPCEKQVVKFVPKKGISNVVGLRRMKHMINIMQRVSRPGQQHPNIGKLHAVHQSPTHILLRMEDCGRYHLYYHLKMRDTKAPLPVQQVGSLIRQIVNAIDHLHAVAKICHRDIKPENIIVTRNGATHPDDIVCKLVDFDVAIFGSMNSIVDDTCGTPPFTAPEIFLQEKGYRAFPVDVWSYGVVLFEIVCGTCSLERILHLPGKKGKQELNLLHKIVKATYDCFRVEGRASSLMAAHCRPELSDISAAIGDVINGALEVTVDERWSIRRVKDEMAELLSAVL